MTTKIIRPTRPPEGRIRRQRVAAKGGRKGVATGESAYIEVRGGSSPTQDDWNPRLCQARSRRTKLQCTRFPRKGFKVCQMHGAGSRSREERGEFPTARAKGRSGRAVQLMRESLRRKLSGTTLAVGAEDAEDETNLLNFATHLEEYGIRLKAIEADPQLRELDDEIKHVTALRQLVTDGVIPMDIFGALKTIPMLAETKSTLMVRKHQMDMKDFVPGAKVREIVRQLVDLVRKYVPEEKLPLVAKDLALLAPSSMADEVDVTPSAS